MRDSGLSNYLRCLATALDNKAVDGVDGNLLRGIADVMDESMVELPTDYNGKHVRPGDVGWDVNGGFVCKVSEVVLNGYGDWVVETTSEKGASSFVDGCGYSSEPDRPFDVSLELGMWPSCFDADDRENLTDLNNISRRMRAFGRADGGKEGDAGGTRE